MDRCLWEVVLWTFTKIQNYKSFEHYKNCIKLLKKILKNLKFLYAFFIVSLKFDFDFD